MAESMGLDTPPTETEDPEATAGREIFFPSRIVVVSRLLVNL